VGEYFLIFWSNAPVFNPITNLDIVPTTYQVTLSLNASVTFNVYNIFSSSADDTLPLPPSSTKNGQSLTFSLADQAVVISLQVSNFDSSSEEGIGSTTGKAISSASILVLSLPVSLVCFVFLLVF